MRRVLARAAVLLPLLFVAGTAGLAAAHTVPTAQAGPGGVEVVFDRGNVAVALGDRFTLPSVVTNTASTPTEPSVAHLNVASLTNDVYVDPEDWSASRSEDVSAVPPGGRASLDWQLQAVNAGSFDVYVVLLPNGAASAGSGPLVVSPPVHVTVAARQTFSAGGALPVAVAVPIAIGLVAAAARYRHRRDEGQEAARPR